MSWKIILTPTSKTMLANIRDERVDFEAPNKSRNLRLSFAPTLPAARRTDSIKTIFQEFQNKD